MKARAKGQRLWGRSRAWTTADRERVTCKQCLNLLAAVSGNNADEVSA